MRLITLSLLSSLTFAAPAFLLPDDVVPKKHVIEMTIDPNKDTFNGWARIQVEIRKPVTVIWVNAKDVTPKEASVTAAGRTYPARAEAVGGEFLSLQLDPAIGPGAATLSIRYQGRLDEKSVVGAYRKKVGADWYVFTTFTPIDARRAFPCFDEPRFKTPWEMTIRVQRDQKAFANARVLRETEEPDGMKAVQFAPTEPLPAEVVAFAVGPFDVLEGPRAGHRTPIRVIAAKGHASEGNAALKASVDVLPRLEAYTGIPYPFGKLDHLALPEGAFGAVENPGLITYLQRALLVAPGEDTPQKTRSIRGLQAHEIGHQWFGDLVTQATWDDVWLSEGFATWFAAKVMDQENPPARRLLSSVAARDRIMTIDAGPRTRPVRLSMKNREDMRGVYSGIVYQKGASILVMLDGWLGEDRIRQGLRAYLRKHSFGNVSTADLESALSSAAAKDPTAVMHSFLDQTGIPVVRAEVQCPKLLIEQTNTAHTWTIPVCWRAAGVNTSCTVLDTSSRQIELPQGAACPAWIYPNAGATGYYRTEWPEAQLSALPLSQLTPAERLMLVYDLRALKNRPDASALLMKLSSDPEPEIAKAAAAPLPNPER